MTLRAKLSKIPVEKKKRKISCAKWVLFLLLFFFIYNHSFVESDAINCDCHFVVISNVDAYIELGTAYQTAVFQVVPRGNLVGALEEVTRE